LKVASVENNNSDDFLSKMDRYDEKSYREDMKMYIQRQYSKGIDSVIDFVDLNRKNDMKSSYLMQAICTRNLKIISRLLKKGAAVGIEELTLTSSKGFVDILKLLISHVIFKTGKPPTNDEFIPILCRAIENEHLDVVRFLLEVCNVVPNGKDPNRGVSPLFIAITKISISDDIIKLIINHGADVNEKIGKMRLLHIACKTSSSLEAIKLMVEKGADIETRTEEGYRPIELVSIERNFRLFEFFKNQGSVPSKLCMDSYENFLQCAVSDGRSQELVHYLLKHGASVNLVQNGMSLLSTAAFHGHDSMITLLRSYGVSIHEE
jgi:ankyrin repeat protein